MKRKSGLKKFGHRSHTSWRRMAKNHELVQLLHDEAEKLNKEIKEKNDAEKKLAHREIHRDPAE